jgi:hypothetical protein
MKNWGTLGVTNVLLLIITVLLLVMVSNCPPSKNARPNDDLSRMGAAPSPTGSSMMNPHAHDHESDSATNMAEAQKNGFSFQNMVFAALRCPSDPTVTLADIGCKGKDAEVRRSFVGELASQNLPPRMMFDKIIEKFGEKALSDEALEIRKNNRR